MFPCTPLVYSLDALCSFLIYILFFTDQKKKKNLLIDLFLAYVFLAIWVLIS